ncbi:MAG: ribonuclease H-like domain-containing protein [Candidatus Sungbacteria bacterium]|uniref:Ribonuclease H-like domain-containing protein n=1 Tax=Candidatus Sungiibacteriota bacterium TaxID=2750080 RepID=A0A931SC72_9BACT|nr:ribonuclease H-like domain-containing protein [Candidatus Sungbacteria bacterium]
MLAGDEIVFDLETQRAFSDLENRNDFGGLGISVLGAFSYRTGQFHVFTEGELSEFEEMLKGARRVVGFNIRHFDYPVLQPHMKSLALRDLPTLDLMTDPAAHLSFRPKLDDLAKATLGVSKSGHGLEAIRWFREGRLDLVKNYCLDDVKITKDLYEYGLQHSQILIESRYGGAKRPIPVSWQRLPLVTATQHSLFTPLENF